MQKLPDGSLVDMPMVRPQTAVPNNYQDHLMQATSWEPRTVELLESILDNYID